MSNSIFTSHRISDRASRRLVRATCALASVLLIASTAGAQTAAPAKQPSFEAVTKSLTDYFASLRDYRAGDLVSQSIVADALAHVTDKTGWNVPDQKEIVGLALADNSFLVTQLSTPAGRKFMRSLDKYGGSYPRLDRLSTISGGQQFIKDMTTRKDGYIMIEYLATTKGGHELGKMMTGVQHGVDLNKPTGRIYTADQLLAALQKSYGKTSP
jgi:hypothetical protein